MRSIKILSVIIMFTVISGCSALLKTEHELFRIQDVYYQSWMVRDIEKGTDVIIELKNLDADVEFTSLVFRGLEVDVTSSSEGSKTVIKGTINTGPSIIENYDYKPGGPFDIIRYVYRGNEYDYP
ncbi:MAG: hypothetical protein U5K32_13010 [Bacteroidales bacterium]|nr:hypothetical protein [Bacteroidales bacterium]